MSAKEGIQFIQFLFVCREKGEDNLLCMLIEARQQRKSSMLSSKTPDDQVSNEYVNSLRITIQGWKLAVLELRGEQEK